QLVDGRPADDDVEPCLKPLRPAQAVDLADGLAEGFLDGVFSPTGIMGDEVGRAIGDGIPAAEKLLPGVGIAGPQARHQELVTHVWHDPSRRPPPREGNSPNMGQSPGNNPGRGAPSRRPICAAPRKEMDLWTDIINGKR